MSVAFFGLGIMNYELRTQHGNQSSDAAFETFLKGGMIVRCGVGGLQ